MARQALAQPQVPVVILLNGSRGRFATYSADRIPRAKAVIARMS